MKKKLVQAIIKLLRSIVVEFVLIWMVVLLYNNYIGTNDLHIASDGLGYYEYLPSIFIHNDLQRFQDTLGSGSDLYERLKKYPYVYVKYKNYLVNKYPCGTALLQLPFFASTLMTVDDDNDGQQNGYQRQFQKSIYHATLFYLFLALFFSKKLLKLYAIQNHVVLLIQILLAFGTGVLLYTYVDTSFSHVYSLFAITTFLYLVKKYFNYPTISLFCTACVLFGLILLLRQINLIILLFIPFIAGSWQHLKTGVLFVFLAPIRVIWGIVIVVAVFSIQSFAWYLQTGDFLLYSYQGEGFNFLSPEFTNILFSYKKGLFIYTPVLILSFAGVVWMYLKGRRFEAIAWVLFFVALTYVLSSWSSWSYGASYGLRAYIDYYTIFFISIALFFGALSGILKAIVIFFTLLTVPLNIIQTYQYRPYILHWHEMDKEKYWKIFLKTDEKY